MRKYRRIVLFLMLSIPKTRTSRRIAAFLMLSSSKIEDISQNCCVFDVVKVKNRKSRRIALVSSLQIDR